MGVAEVIGTCWGVIVCTPAHDRPPFRRRSPMTNLNTTPNPFGKHSFRDNAVDSAANQTYEFDIDGSVAASVENTATSEEGSVPTSSAS